MTSLELVDVLVPEVLELMLEKKLSGYDASYLWVSRERKLPLISLDDRLNAAATQRP